MKKSSRKKRLAKRVLRLPDLDYAKRAVLNTLGSPESKRSYEFAIDDFVNWYCSEPRLAFSRTVVLRYRLDLEGRRLAPATINLRLAAVRRLAYEAADTGLLSPELAAGIQRVKGAKRLQGPDLQKLKGRRDKAILALMLGCGLRRGEVASLRLDHLQLREDHWVIADLIGKAAPIRSVPVPTWVKSTIDGWTTSAPVTEGRLFRCVSRTGSFWGNGITEKVIWHVVKDAARKAGISKLSPHDCRRTCARLCRAAGGELEQIQFLLGHVSVETTERYLGCKQRLQGAVNGKIGLEP